MEIINYTQKQDGNLIIPVDSRLFPAICGHLHKKRFNLGGTYNSGNDFNDIWIKSTIEKVNEALADFDESKAV